MNCALNRAVLSNDVSQSIFYKLGFRKKKRFKELKD